MTLANSILLQLHKSHKLSCAFSSMSPAIGTDVTLHPNDCVMTDYKAVPMPFGLSNLFIYLTNLTNLTNAQTPYNNNNNFLNRSSKLPTQNLP